MGFLIMLGATKILNTNPGQESGLFVIVAPHC